MEECHTVPAIKQVSTDSSFPIVSLVSPYTLGSKQVSNMTQLLHQVALQARRLRHGETVVSVCVYMQFKHARCIHAHLDVQQLQQVASMYIVPLDVVHQVMHGGQQNLHLRSFRHCISKFQGRGTLSQPFGAKRR